MNAHVPNLAIVTIRVNESVTTGCLAVSNACRFLFECKPGLPVVVATGLMLQVTAERQILTPCVIVLLTKTGNANCSIGGDLHDGISIVIATGSFDHRDQCTVVDAVNMVVGILVAVALKNG